MNPTVPGSDLESILCLGNLFTKNEQSLVGDPHDARTVVSRFKRSGDFCLPCLVWKSTLFVFVSIHAHISILVPAVVSTGCADRSCHDVFLVVLSILS